MVYSPDNIEKKWQKKWQEEQLYKVSEDETKPKYYILDMFPYPSGAGLHVGHPLGYIATDIFARYKRSCGFNVLHPMGYDAFGLPAEQYAIQTGVHPAKSTDENIKRYRAQLDNIGFSYDWSRAVKTSDPAYYKWTQWVFIKLFSHYYDLNKNKATPIEELIEAFEKSGNASVNASSSQEYIFTAEEWHNFSPVQKDEILMNYRLAFRKVGYVNWCEALGTVLANDEVKDGLSERGGYPVEKRAMLQWSLRITAYAERLLTDLTDLEWSEAMKTVQRNWIGRSEGATINFPLSHGDQHIEIFTTRPDTIFGSTFMVLAPEHELVSQITTESEKSRVEKYLRYVSSRSEVDRISEGKDVTGAFTGAYAINPITGQPIPIWIAEYVLKDYGSGAIMAVPSNDERDRAFATKFGLEIIAVVDQSAHPGASIEDKIGIMINSGFLNGLHVKDAISTTLEKVEADKIGYRKINYKLRDANFSRQRYWGEPFPVYYDNGGVTHILNENELPLTLPDLENFQPTEDGKSPLARAEDWVFFKDGLRRETDTMPGYAGSSWYFLRYMDAGNPDEFASKKALSYWKDVDLYVGGTEHAVGHLMYSRFWHKFLYDLGYLETKEPFKKLINQGMIQGIIEFVRVKKEKVNGKIIVKSFELIGPEEENEYMQVPVHIDFVTDYGSQKPHLNLQGIRQLIAWRQEYADAVFVAPEGTYSDGSFKAQGEANDIQIRTQSETGKMSKRYYNVVNPDDIVARYGADCFRMYEMFLGPVEQSKPWDTKGIDGVSKFLKKYWSLYFNPIGAFEVSLQPATDEELRVLHTAIKKVREDIEKFSFNTCVSAFMIAVNELKRLGCNKRDILEPLNILLAPFAPHVAEELWALMAREGSVVNASFPDFDASKLQKDALDYPVCLNGKKRDLISLSSSLMPNEIEELIKNHEQLQNWLKGASLRKVIVVPGKMINLVAG